MKSLSTSILGVILLLGVAFTGWSFESYELSRSELGEFKLKADETLKLNNRYGQVNVKTWDKEETKIDVLITVDAKNEKKAQELMDLIEIRFTEGSGYVQAETIIESKDSWGWQINYNVKYEINYDVFMPKDAYLEIANKYGNAEVASLDRDITAQIKYGKINFDDQGASVNLTLGYGSAKMSSLKNLTGEVKYSDVKFAEAMDVDLQTKYSNFDFGKMAKLKIDSGYDNFTVGEATSIKNDGKYDDWNIGAVGAVDFDTKYTDVEIEQLNSMGRFYQKYGEIDIDDLGPDAKELTFSLGYTDVTIKRAATGYYLDFDGSYSDCSHHTDFKVDEIDDEGTNTILRGSHGNGQTKIDVSMKYGDFYIR